MSVFKLIISTKQTLGFIISSNLSHMMTQILSADICFPSFISFDLISRYVFFCFSARNGGSGAFQSGGGSDLFSQTGLLKCGSNRFIRRASSLAIIPFCEQNKLYK